MILLIDNYDSFSYNLYQMIGAIDPEIRVIRNDAMSVEQIGALAPGGIVLSPGPGRPEDAGVGIDVVKELGSRYPILGVCLGHQSICTAYGGVVGYARELMQGKQSVCSIDVSCRLFAGLEKTELVGRYHSLAAEARTLPACLEVTARTEDGEIMAVRHRENEVYGIQFHPESILTPHGNRILENFVKISRP